MNSPLIGPKQLSINQKVGESNEWGKKGRGKLNLYLGQGVYSGNCQSVENVYVCGS